MLPHSGSFLLSTFEEPAADFDNRLSEPCRDYLQRTRSFPCKSTIHNRQCIHIYPYANSFCTALRHVVKYPHQTPPGNDVRKLILEPEELANLVETRDILLVDLSQPGNYAQAHIEGALHVHPSELIAGIKPAVGKLPGNEQLNRLFSRIGYRPEQQIVAYDDEGGGWAGRFIWTLDIIGHQHSAYLNGGIHAWVASGLPTTDIIPNPTPNPTEVTIDTRFIASKDEVLASLDDPDSIIWDARTAQEYTGAKVVAARGGRIPGAVNLEWTGAMDPDRQLRIRSDIVELLNSLGLSADKKIITHCQTHHRSGFTYLVGKSLGYQIRAYDGSWSEWGNDPDTPVEVG